MILNSKNNNFIIRFARGWVYEEIMAKYSPYLNRLPIPYETVQDYLESTIQSITFPSVAAEPVEQVLYEDPVKWKGAKKLLRYMDKKITVNFKLTEGYINYWIMYDLFNQYYSLDQENPFLNNVYITFLDHIGFEFVRVQLEQIVFLSISDLELNYSSTTAEFKTFSTEFSFNYLKISNNISNTNYS
jgi:hypothetical protein